MSLTKEQVLNLKCLNHPTKNCDQLYIGNKIHNHRICVLCAKENRLQLEELIEIEDVLNFNMDSSINIFPALLKSISSSKIKEIKNLDGKIMKDLNNYYDKLVSNVYDAISISIENHKKKMEEVSQQIASTNTELVSKESILNIQKILLTSEHIRSSESSLHSCILDIISQPTEKDIEANLDNLLQIKDSYSLQQAEYILKDFVKKIENLKFFDSSPVSSSTQNYTKPNLFKEESQIPTKSSSPYSIPKFERQQEKQQDFNLQGKSILNILHSLPSQNYNLSKDNLLIQRINNEIKITNTSVTQNNQSWSQCYMSQELQVNKKYCIQVSLNNQYYDQPFYYFGLLNSVVKDTKNLGYDTSGYYTEHDGGHCTQIIKGQRLDSNGAKKIGVKRLEFRIHIQEKLFKVSSPPSYQNVVQLKDFSCVNLKNSYIFGIMIRNPQDSVTIEEVLEVESFSTYM